VDEPLRYEQGPHGCKHCGKKELQHRLVDGRWECILPDYLVALHPHERTTCCRSCHRTIVYRTAPWGRPHPVNLQGGSHFGTCPAADQYRGARQKKQRALDLEDQ
jgi:ribosomal protein L37AE/L43A